MMERTPIQSRPTGVPAHRAGATLVEVVAAMAIMSVLMLAMGSTIYLASKAIPTNQSPNEAITQTSQTAQQIAQELRTAVYITERSANAVAFALADRNSDGLPETVRYAWSGTASDPLTRQTNNAAAEPILDNVQQFDLSYAFTSATETYPGPPVEGAEQLLVSHDPLVTAATEIVDGNDWPGQYIDPTLPPDTLSWSVKRVTFRMRNAGILPLAGTMLVQIRPADASNHPTGVVLEQVLFLHLLLFNTFSWQQFNFSNVNGLSPSERVCLVIRDNLPPLNTQVQLDSAGGSGLLITDDAGVTWTHNGSKALQYYVYGTITQPGPDQAVTRQHLTSVRLALEAGDADTALPIETSARTANLPEVLTTVWEADFSGDPTAIDIDQDTTPDWAMNDAGAFVPATLAGGVWRIDRAMNTNPVNKFLEVTALDVRFRDTTSGTDGAGVWMNIDRTGTTHGAIYAHIKLEADNTQTLTVQTKPNTFSFQTLYTQTGLPSGFVDLTLLVDPGADTVHIKINGQESGTFSYPRYTGNNDEFIQLRRVGDGAEFDHVRIRVGGAGS